MELVQSVRKGTTEVVGRDVTRGENLYLIRDGDRLLLPVYTGMHFGVEIISRASTMMAFPAFVGRGDNRRNVYWANEATDPNDCPADGGMWEAYEYGRVSLDSFCLPGSQRRPFKIVDDGLGFEGFNASEITVYARTPVDPHAAPPAATGTSFFDSLVGAGSRGMSGTRSAPSIGAGDVQGDDRIQTGLGYNRDAGDPVARVVLVTRDEALTLLDHAGVPFHGSWAC